MVRTWLDFGGKRKSSVLPLRGDGGQRLRRCAVQKGLEGMVGGANRVEDPMGGRAATWSRRMRDEGDGSWEKGPKGLRTAEVAGGEEGLRGEGLCGCRGSTISVPISSGPQPVRALRARRRFVDGRSGDRYNTGGAGRWGLWRDYRRGGFVRGGIHGKIRVDQSRSEVEDGNNAEEGEMDSIMDLRRKRTRKELRQELYPFFNQEGKGGWNMERRSEGAPKMLLQKKRRTTKRGWKSRRRLKSEIGIEPVRNPSIKKHPDLDIPRP